MAALPFKDTAGTRCVVLAAGRGRRRPDDLRKEQKSEATRHNTDRYPVHAEMPEKEEGTMPSASAKKSVDMQNNESSTNDEAVSEAVDQLASLKVAGAGDPELWKPHPPTEECPVCVVPLPLADDGMSYWACCGKTICGACTAETLRARNVINIKRAEKKLPLLDGACSFCRTVPNVSESEYEERIRKGDGEAACCLALDYRGGNDDMNIPKDEVKSLKLFHHAADDLGSSRATAERSMYFYGDQGAAKDNTKGRKYLEGAVKMGNVVARISLACVEAEEGKMDLAVRHWKLAAIAGDEPSMRNLWKCFYKGALEKAELEETLRAHKEACDAMNSVERERRNLLDALAESGNDVALFELLKSYYKGEINAKQLKVAMKAHQNGS